ncbi:LysR family transcriptional regulator [Neogemmobacter tilapiae]|uniref:Transcriptional regulator n=1 Tax=Neogemmobacter tilapiae TaxID=875041 RepID=A0A918TMF2_9RHOB|nr:LysR family transcriptional regulator [Gemmobacter tilapiae]GHC51538.1 transcriptional regulator [Gemmobacter tilapiae]
MEIDWLRLPPLSSLRAFEAAARLGGFSAAARALNVTHAAVAQQVRGLEEHLGCALILREGRGMVLTADGRRLAVALNDGFGQIAGVLTALGTEDGERPVRVTLTASFASQWLMPRLRDFWREYPDIALTLHPEAKIVDLRREGMDLGIRYGRGDWPGLVSTYLASARMVVAGAPDLFAGQEIPDTNTLSKMEWIITANSPEQDEVISYLGINPETISRTEFPNEELSIAAARQGLGLIVESIALIEDDIREGRLRMVRDSDDSQAAYYIVMPPGRQRAAVRAFVKWLSSAA